MENLEIGETLPFRYNTRLLWKSEIMTVKRTQWLMVVYEVSDLNWDTGETNTSRTFGYFWLSKHGWRRETEHRDYRHGSRLSATPPEGVIELYRANEAMLDSLLRAQPAPVKPSRYLLGAEE